MDKWNGVDRRKSTAEIADATKNDLANHLVECTSRYNSLKSEVAVQGKQLDRVVAAVDKIDDKLDNIIASFDAKVDREVDQLRRDVDEQRKSAIERYNTIMLGVIGALAAVLGGVITFAIENFHKIFS